MVFHEKYFFLHDKEVVIDTSINKNKNSYRVKRKLRNNYTIGPCLTQVSLVFCVIKI